MNFQVPETAVLSCFSTSYAEARQKFLKACRSRSLCVDSRLNPNAKGVNGESLYADIVRIGRADASKVLLLLSGTHGVEGYCGSGVQIALLNNGYFIDLPDDLSVIMIHAMNPYGFSHDRRVTEDNVDLNRNFLDFSQPDLPGMDYARIHEFILPNAWQGLERQHADEQLHLFVKTHGMKAYQTAISSGQYRYPDGVFYGGQSPTWSNIMFRSFQSEYLVGRSVIGTLDFHTGLGPHGYGELITIGTERQKERAAQWYGDQVTDPQAGTSSSANLDGMVAHSIVETLTDTKLAFVTLEFGTFPVNRVITALRGDNWLYHKGDPDTALGKTIKQDIKEAFYPDTNAWKLSVWARSSEVVQLALTGVNQTN
ncbi:MAG: M14 family metallopeptidase [Pseudomonadota bacterium]